MASTSIMSEKVKRFEWQPTERFIHGIVTKPFLPLDRHPQLSVMDSHFRNIYTGDNIYIFEQTADSKWCRAYLLVQPLPEDFTANINYLSESLPTEEIRIVVCPTKFVYQLDELVPEFSFLKLPGTDRVNAKSDNESISRMHELLRNINSEQSKEAEKFLCVKPKRPPFPEFKLHDKSLIDEIVAMQSQLCSHIFAAYAVGEFELFEWLKTAYYQLDDIRCKLFFNISTTEESQRLINDAIGLTSGISRFLSGKDQVHRFRDSRSVNADPSGYNCILLRDSKTGKLPSYEEVSPHEFAVETMILAVSPNFMRTNSKAFRVSMDQNHVLDHVEPAQVLIDFTEVVGAPEYKEKFENLSVYIYLRTAKRRLTEPFVVQVNSANIVSLDSISAALFNNIPSTEIKKSKIYLIVELVETFNVEETSHPTSSVPSLSGENVDYIRHGVVAGAADISRIFSRDRNVKEIGSSFHYRVNLYRSYFKAKRSTSPPGSNEFAPSGPLPSSKNSRASNNGWGGLVDRIIDDSDQGVAIHQDVQSITVNVKEFRRNDLLASSDQLLSNSAIKLVPPCFYDPITAPLERIYLTVGNVKLSNSLEGQDIQTITIVLSSSNKKVSFWNGFNQEQPNSWQFVDVKPGEAVGETVRIEGVFDMESNETLKLSAFCGTLIAKAKFYIKKGNQILEYEKRSTFQLMSANNEPLIDVELRTEYVGKAYNIVRPLYDLIAQPKGVIPTWSNSLNEEMEDPISAKIQAINNVDIHQLVQYFDLVLIKLLEYNYAIFVEQGENTSMNMKEKAFFFLLQFLYRLIIRQETHKHLIHKFFEKFTAQDSSLPPLGTALIDALAHQFVKAQQECTQVFRAACRTYVLTIMLALKSSRESDVRIKASLMRLMDSILTFFGVTDDSALLDQTTVLNDFDVFIGEITGYFTPEDLIGYYSKLISACLDREKAFELGVRVSTSKERKFIRTNFLLMRRVLESHKLGEYIFSADNEDKQTFVFLNQLIEYSAKPILNQPHFDLTSIRLANNIFVTVFENAKNPILQRNLIRLIPTLCRVFLLMCTHSRGTDQFKPLRKFSCLFPTRYPFPDVTTDSTINGELVIEVLIELATILSSATKLVENRYGQKASYIKIIEDCTNDNVFNSMCYVTRFTREDILVAIYTTKVMMRGQFYPSEKWLTLNAMFIRSSLTLLVMFKDIMINYNIPPSSSSVEFDSELWSEYFTILLMLANHKVSDITVLSELPRKAVYLIAGDVRTRVAEIIEPCWEALITAKGTDSCDLNGLEQSTVYPMVLMRQNTLLISEMVRFTFQRHAEARRVGAWLLWTLCIHIWKTHGSLTIAGEHIITALYNDYQSGKTVPTAHGIKSFFTTMLHTIQDDEMVNIMLEFVSTTCSMMSVLATMQDLPNGEEFDDLRTANQLTIFEYLMRANKPESFHTLIHDLFLSYVKKKDYVQAALSLELLASTYEWNPNITLPECKKPPFPQQSAFERKEYLLKEAARNFKKGLKLEKALSIYKDLAEVYEKINYDLSKLSFVHGQISNLYTDLQNIDRLVPSYFKISFVGNGFPDSLNGKVFIYEGFPFEHITSIFNRLRKLYLGTQLINSQEKLESMLLKPPQGRWLHVSSVEPQFEISQEYSTNDKKGTASSKIRGYIENRDLRRFSSSRRLPGATSVLDLWVKEVVYETASTFPTLLKRSEVCNVIERNLSPIENAIRSLHLKLQDLAGLENMCYKILSENGNTHDLFNELARALAGTIDAPVNGGITEYREFFNVDEEQVSKSQLATLRSLFDELAILLNRCLGFYKKLCPQSMEQSYEALCDQFEVNYSSEISANKILTRNYDDLAARLTAMNASQHSLSSVLNGSQTLLSDSEQYPSPDRYGDERFASPDPYSTSDGYSGLKDKSPLNSLYGSKSSTLQPF
ncbi:HCL249Cp [Eremothecium sinecaudum]|uniref:HCL249Cp n=1 Tax=Eremothecium sinecaudum TaxID=45286 RepID=A0A0X8HR42_9SACH|nr:HCL249Cp [Eremothecium sinecaudum]AMD19902.1 HCL249Cp [Eremothecium sinecaudum]